MALAAAEAMGAPAADMHEAAPEAAPAAETGPVEAPLAAPAMSAPEVPLAAAPSSRRKSSLVWRTAWIWLPFAAGFAGQAYLDVVRPLLEKTTS